MSRLPEETPCVNLPFPGGLLCPSGHDGPLYVARSAGDVLEAALSVEDLVKRIDADWILENEDLAIWEEGNGPPRLRAVMRSGPHGRNKVAYL